MTNQNKKTGVVIAGGTGGHIIPGISLAQELVAKDFMLSVHFLSAERNRSFADFKQLNIPIHFYEPPRIPRNPIKIVSFLLTLRASYKLALSLFKIELKADFVVAMGGYTVLPALLAARRLKIPYYLCEQNAIPGRATRLFSKKAKRIFLSMPLSESKFKLPIELCEIVGNPVKPGLTNWFNKNTKTTNQNFSLSSIKPKNKRTFKILVLGGSQGALQLNQMCQGVIQSDLQQSITVNLQWDIQCGEAHLEAMQNQLPKNNFKHVNLFGYHHAIGELLLEADLLVCRSGAGVVGEGALFGLPMILVPYPWAQDDHQTANARYYETNGAAFVISTSDVDVDGLYTHILKLVTDIKLRSSMSEMSQKLATPDAATKICNSIETNM